MDEIICKCRVFKKILRKEITFSWFLVFPFVCFVCLQTLLTTSKNDEHIQLFAAVTSLTKHKEEKVGPQQ